VSSCFLDRRRVRPQHGRTMSVSASSMELHRPRAVQARPSQFSSTCDRTTAPASSSSFRCDAARPSRVAVEPGVYVVRVRRLDPRRRSRNSENGRLRHRCILRRPPPRFRRLRPLR
jgi:hypothetical protein